MLASEGNRGDGSASRSSLTEQQFTVVRRGLDEAEVRRALRDLSERLAEEQRKYSELEARVLSSSGLTLDETTLMSKLGEETARVLRVAHEAAADLRTKAEARAEELRSEAEQVAETVRSEAAEHASQTRDQVATEASEARAALDTELSAQREAVESELVALKAEAARQRDAIAEERDRATKELEETLDHRRDAHLSELAILREGAERDAVTTVEEAKEHGRSMVAEARSVRERILLDLDRRRRTLTDQIGELERSRDRLVRSVEAVRLGASEAMTALQRAGTSHTADRSVAQNGEDESAANSDVIDDFDETDVSSVVMGELGDIDFSVFDIDLPAEEPGVAEGTPEESAETDPGPDAKMDPADVGTSEADTVGALFARLKAERVDAAPETDTSEVGESETVEPAVAEAESPLAPSGEESHETESQASPVAESESEAATSLTAQRDDALEPSVTLAARRIKRVLQDDQNQLLESLRSVKGRGKKTVATVDRPADWWAAFSETVERAATAGAAVARPDQATDVASALDYARPLVEAEGARWNDLVQAALADDAGEAHGRITAVFREYRREELESFVDFVLVGAYNAGVVAALPEGTSMAWIAEATGVCPEADDNALEPTCKGNTFPTGQAFPPAHPGCRCVVADAALVVGLNGTAVG
ncbi:MAG: hypothetical protein WBD02_02425 [Acidimicrobiia bacterium]